MKRFTIKEKLLSLGGQDFVIRDEGGAVAYRVSGKMLSFGDKLIVKDGTGSEVARIEQKVMAFVKTYRIKQGGRTIATVKKKALTLMRDRFRIDVPGPDDLELTGALLEHDYTITRGGKTVARVSKAWLSMTDSYGVEVADDEEALLPLAAALVVDLVIHERDNTRVTNISD